MLTNSDVALKVMRRAGRTKGAPDALRREVAVLKRVHHPNIVSCLEVIDDPDHAKVFVVLELVKNGRLPWRTKGNHVVCRHEWDKTQEGMKLKGMPLDSADLATCQSPIMPTSPIQGFEPSSSPCESFCSLELDFNRESFSDQFQYVPCITMEQARHAILDVVTGLEYLHAHGIVHRDIKPDNLLWTRDHRVKICDFSTSFINTLSHGTSFHNLSSTAVGDSASFEGKDEMMRTIGTPGFMAPELCCTRPDGMDLETLQQVDVWSLGVTLYCLIFARLPFVAQDEYQLYRKMAEQDLYIPEQRLRPVPPSSHLSDPVIFSTGQYRRDDVIEDEHLDKELLNLLRRMLTRDARKRIRLADINKHPWLNQTSHLHRS